MERGVAKERVAMFKNLESGAQPGAAGTGVDPKIRVDVSSVCNEKVFFSIHIARRSEVKERLKLSFIGILKEFRWHVNVCQPINCSTLRRKSQIHVGHSSPPSRLIY